MANRYWVGGTDNWDGTAGSKWASTSGGAGGASVPTTSDDVFFDAASGAVTVTVLTTNGAARNLDFTGFTGTWAGSQGLSLAGSITLGAGMTRTYTGGIICGSGAATTRNITSNGKTFASLWTFNVAGATWVWQDNFNNGSSNIQLTNGSLDTNGKTLTLASFNISNNSNTRSITLGASTINCTTWSHLGTNVTLNEGTSTIALSAVSPSFLGGGETYYNVTMATSGATPLPTITGANTFNNLTITGNAVKVPILTLSADQVVSGTFTINGNSAINRILICSTVVGTPRTITAAVVSASYVDFMDITGAGAGSWNLSAITGNSGDCGGNSGITFTTSATQTWNGNGGNWSTVARWTSRIPLPQDDCVFDATSFSSGSQTVTADMPRSGRSINWTGVTNTPAFNIGNVVKTIYGSLTLVTGMTIGAGTGQVTFGGRSSYTLTSAGLTFNGGFTLEAPGGTMTLQDALSCGNTNVLIVNNGTFDANDKAISVGLVNISGTGTRVVYMGNGTWTLTGTGNVWQASTTTNLTFNAENSLIQVNNAGASGKSFLGGSLTYHDFIFTGAGSGALTVDGSNTFADFAIATAPKSVLFTAGTTQVVATWSAKGSAGNLITINSTTTVNFALSKASGVVNSNYLSIANSDAGGGAAWYAGANSTDAGGGNTGWIFTAAVIGITKSLQYTVDSPVSLTKQLQYTVKTSASVTKQCQYAVVITPSAITKPLQYIVVSPVSITKQLQYCVLTTPSAVQLGLQYAVLVATAITKQLIYSVETSTGINKPLMYTVVAPVSVTLPLTYSVVAPVSITKQLQYTVGTPGSYTKQLQYTVKAPVALTLALAYRVITSASITKGMVYEIILPTQEVITKPLVYYVAVPTGVTKPLQYVVNASHVISLGLTYRMKPGYPYAKKTTPYSSGNSPYTRSAGPYTKLSP